MIKTYGGAFASPYAFSVIIQLEYRKETKLMKIIGIKIEDYKSVKNPVSIKFFDDKPTVLIGKNGSGKTNIAEALERIFKNNGSEIIPYDAEIELSREEFSRIFPNEEYSKEKCVFTASNGNGGQVDRISSSYIVPFLREKVKDMRILSDNLKSVIEEYKAQADKISCYEVDEPLRCFDLLGSNGKITNYYYVESRTKYITDACERFEKSLSEGFRDENTFVFTSNTYLPYSDMALDFKLEYREPDLAEFEKGFIKIDTAAIKAEIDKINAATGELCEKISDCMKRIDERISYFNNILEIPPTHNTDDGKYCHLLKEVRSILNPECLFLRNESSNVIFRVGNDDELRARNEAGSLIKELFKKSCNTDESGEAVTEDDLKNFETALNQGLPQFEKGMYEKVTVEQDGKELEIYLHEKTGEKISLNSTSAGRRWYFTYYFMKNRLKVGDVFIVDEPAAMLHPLAQRDILKELNELANSGICVIYSTHSPYLIPKEWKTVHFVSMGENGTETSKVETPKDGYENLKQISGNDIFELQEIYNTYDNCDKKIISRNCREAVREYIKAYKAEHKTAEKNGYDLTDEAYEQLSLSESTIKKWGSGSRFPKLENVIMVAVKTGKNIMELMCSE